MRGKYYVPSSILNVPARIWNSVEKRVNGVMSREYEPCEDVIWVGAKSYGGTEKNVDGIYTIEDTIEFTMYYNPEMKSSSRLELLGDGSMWEVLNTPENIDMRGAFMRFKGRRLHG